MKVFYCPGCKLKMYLLPSDKDGDTDRCISCGTTIIIDITNTQDEFQEDNDGQEQGRD